MKSNIKYRQRLKPKYICGQSDYKYYYWGYVEDAFVSPVSKNLSDSEGEKFLGFSDDYGCDIYEGDLIEFFAINRTHSDACDYFSVEPENNWPVNEVYPEKMVGEVVSTTEGSWEVRCKYKSFNLADLSSNVADGVLDCHYTGLLDYSLRDFVEMCHDIGLKSPIKNAPIKVVGNNIDGIVEGK